MKLHWLSACPALLLGCASCPPCEVQTPSTPAPCSPPPRAQEAVPRVSTGADSGGETRTQRVIASVVVQHRQKIRACYEAERVQHPNLAGTLTLHFTLDPRGKVTTAHVVTERSTLLQPTLHQCAIDALRTISFPPSSRGFESQVNYPFDFKPQ